MDNVIKVLTDQPEIGILSSIGSGTIYWTGLFNPILSFLTLLVGLMIGLVTLGIKVKQWRKL